MIRTYCAMVAGVMLFATVGLAAEKAAPTTQPLTGEWQSLFDGKTLGKWKVTEFGGQAEVKIKDASILLPIGNDMTGVTYGGEFPKINYELELEAARVDGNDFFCGLTFPVNKNCASLILGGWGGTLCGISSIDGHDASDNSTTSMRQFTKGQWYKVRVRVTEGRIQAWLDKDPIVNVDIAEKRMDVRMEVELCKPLGIATWQTAGQMRNIRVRTLYADEIEEAKKMGEEK